MRTAAERNSVPIVTPPSHGGASVIDPCRATSGTAPTGTAGGPGIGLDGGSLCGLTVPVCTAGVSRRDRSVNRRWLPGAFHLGRLFLSVVDVTLLGRTRPGPGQAGPAGWEGGR